MNRNYTKYAIIDLHLHLDGALSPEAILKVALTENLDLPTYVPEELMDYLKVSKNCESLVEYLTKFDIPNLALQSEYGLTECTLDLLRRLSSQGLKYVEIRMAPQLSVNKGLTQDEVVNIVLKALKRGEELYEIKSNLILCMMRHASKEINKETITVAKKYLGLGVVALDLAGAEAPHLNEEFVEEFALAKSLDIPFTIHSGEDAGAFSVLSAVKLGANRIGHGIHAIEDPNVVDVLVKKGIPLEICPTSNMDTKSIRFLDELPVKPFLDKGVKVTINTDDPTVSNTTLAREYELLDVLGLSEEEVKTIALNSVEAAFLSEEEKENLRQYIYSL